MNNEDRIRKEIELCESLSGFQLMHSSSGGMGSGFSGFILEILANNYPKAIKNTFTIYPGGPGVYDHNCGISTYCNKIF